MRIGLSAGGKTVDDIVAQARAAEADGFTSLWFGGAILGDPLVAMAIAGRETSKIELGTSILQTYPCHPLLQANRAASVANAMGRGLALGIGASHESQVTGIYGLGYDHPGRNTEEYATILAALLRGESVNFDGVDWTTHAARPIELSQPVSLLLAAMAPRMLRVAGAIADGTITFLAQAAALESHIVPKIRAAAATAGRGEPRVIAGLPVAVHDDEGEARAAIAGSMGGIFDALPNYQRVLAAGGCDRTADAAIVGDKRSVQRQLQRLIDAGATDIWASPFPVGNDPQGSLRRTRDALMELLD